MKAETRALPTTLYRYYDESHVLLYVGIASQFQTRAYQHGKSAKWVLMASYVKLEHFKSRKEALRAESLAIKTENPRFNIVGSLLGSVYKYRQPSEAKKVKAQRKNMHIDAGSVESYVSSGDMSFMGFVSSVLN